MNTKPQILVTNLDLSTSEEDLEALFAEFGEVETITMGLDPKPDVLTKCALIYMPDADEADGAMEELRGEWVDGKQLKIKLYEGDDIPFIANDTEEEGNLLLEEDFTEWEGDDDDDSATSQEDEDA